MSDSMRLSLPESSKEFAKSQDSVIAQARRLFRLKPLIQGSQSIDPPEKTLATDVFQKSDQLLINDAIEVLKTRNGKPYAASAILEALTLTMKPPYSHSLES